MKVAVVTPYYKEKISVLRQAHDSVRSQTYPCRHFMVADGFPHAYFQNNPDCDHTSLPLANADNGNTPRAIGGLLAQAQGYDAVAYLDADNWFEPEHIARLVAEQQRNGTMLAVAKRRFVDLDGEPLQVSEGEENENRHFDTSGWLVTRPAFDLLRAWLMPKPLSPICDRIFLAKVIHDRYPVAVVNERTVVFRTQYAAHYERIGRQPPPGAKRRDDIWGQATPYLTSKLGAQEVVASLGFYPIFN